MLEGLVGRILGRVVCEALGHEWAYTDEFENADGHAQADKECVRCGERRLGWVGPPVAEIQEWDDGARIRGDADLRVESPFGYDPTDDQACPDCGHYRKLVGPLSHSGRVYEGGDLVCRPCARSRNRSGKSDPK